MSMEFLTVENLRRIDLRPGQKFVLSCDRYLSGDQREAIMVAWKQFMGESVPLLVMHKSMELTVIDDETTAKEKSDAKS